MSWHSSGDHPEQLRLSNDLLPADTNGGPAAVAPKPRKAEGHPGAAAPGYGGYGEYSAPVESAAGEQVHVMDYVRVLYKRRWTALTTLILVVGWVTAQTVTATPVFEARTQLLIENQDQKVVEFQQVLDENRTTFDYYQTQYRILESRVLARRTLEAEQLWDDPVFSGANLAPANIILRPMDWPGEVIRLAASLRPAKPAAETDRLAPPESTAQAAAIDRFLRNLTIAPIRNSRLVDIKYRSSDPRLAARLANALAKQYIEQNLEFKFLATKEAAQFLSERMGEQRQALDRSEQALQKYREDTGAVALQDRQNIVVQRLADLNAAVTRARTDRIEKEAVYNQIRDVQTMPAAVDTVPAIMTNAFIQQLKGQLTELQRQQAQLGEKLGDRHPEMLKVRTAIESTQTRMNGEVQKVVQALRNDYQAALANERALMASLEQQRGEAQELNRASIQYGVLERDAAMNRQMFEGLLQRRKETDVAGELKTSNIRVVDQAEVPRKPSSPNKQRNILFALLGGSLLGITFAFFFEYLDSRIKSPDHIKAQLGLPYLGMIPAIKYKSKTGEPMVNNGVPAHFSESFRSIRTNVLFSSAENGAKSVVVTSTAPGEGKTLVATNLSISLALAGQRVLLIDADMRRPKLHTAFEIPQEPGLSNLMVGDAKTNDVVKESKVPNLWLIAAGKHPPNPAELLGSKRFNTFMSSLATHFDWIIIDSPPVLAVTDPAVLAHKATGVLFVVGAEMTDRRSAKIALEQLDSANAKYVGAVLNRVNLKRNAPYYSHYYRAAYSQYYDKTPHA